MAAKKKSTAKRKSSKRNLEASAPPKRRGGGAGNADFSRKMINLSMTDDICNRVSNYADQFADEQLGGAGKVSRTIILNHLLIAGLNAVGA